MGFVFLGLSLALLLVWMAPGASAQQAPGGKVFGLTVDDRLVSFNQTDPGRILNNAPIRGVQPGESIVGIDFRPATGMLFGIGDTSRVYRINVRTGVATAVGAPFTPALRGNVFGVDFNPTVDRIRVVSNANQNLRLNPDTGAIAGADTDLQYGAGDPNAGQDPEVVGSAYTNNVAGATSTMLYGIDSKFNTLVEQDPPNNGTLLTEGSLGVNTNVLVGFDLAPGYRGLASLTPEGRRSRLYAVSFASGRATDRGQIGTARNIRDIAIPLGAPAN